MTKPIALAEFISLGQSLCIVANPQPWHVDVVFGEIGKFLRQLSICGMTRARTAANTLDGLQIPFDRRTGLIGGVALKELQAYMRTIIETLFEEAREQEIVAIDTGAVSQKLRGVSNSITLTDSQEQLQLETVLCLERGAFRAAIVMGWCFAYDVIRWWIYNDSNRLQQFNAELATVTKRNGNRVYGDITDYDDFYSNKAPAEGRLIELSEAASLFGGKVARNLRHYLDTRNDYAHASSTQPTANQANAFIEHLIDIITAAPFK